MRPLPSSPLLVPSAAATAGLAVLAVMATAGCSGKSITGTVAASPYDSETDDTAEPTRDSGTAPGTPAPTYDTGDTSNPYGSGSGTYAGTWPGSPPDTGDSG